jgi:[ribosomal protein S5]-alanine N-acetyltransferase
MIKTKRIESKRLILRGLEVSDIPSYERHFVDYDVISQLSSVVRWPYPKDGVAQFMSAVVWPQQGQTRWDWGLFLKHNPSEKRKPARLLLELGPRRRGEILKVRKRE